MPRPCLIVLQDNRAMTIKDLAEMSVKCGLVCQKYRTLLLLFVLLLICP